LPAEKLVTLCFEIAIASAGSMHVQSDEHIADWMRERLRLNVINVSNPIAMSWGEYLPL